MRKMPIPLSVACLISLGIGSSCVNRAPSLRMLEERAEYGNEAAVAGESLKLSNVGAIAPLDEGGVPVRTSPRTATIWIHPHETAGKEYFWGGWITVVVEGDRWEVLRPNTIPPDGVPEVTPKKQNKRGTKHE